MSRFLAGFATACALWGIGAAVYFSGVLTPDDEPMEEIGPLEEEMVEADPGSPDEPRRRRRKRRTGGGGGDDYAQAPPSRPAPRGNATTGDDLGENDLRLMDLGNESGGGGEQQLTGGQIDGAFDGAMSRIRRCLILAAGDDPVSGRLVFGMRIAGTGRVTRVNLAGPAALTTGDAGECLRGAARGIQFPGFDGPEMVVRYPLTLD